MIHDWGVSSQMLMLADEFATCLLCFLLVSFSVTAHARHVSDQVCALLWLLEASKNHLSPRDVLLRVDEILEHVLVRPHDARLLVRLGKAESFNDARLPSKHSPQRRALL